MLCGFPRRGVIVIGMLQGGTRSKRIFMVRMPRVHGQHGRKTHFEPRRDRKQHDTGNGLPCHMQQAWQKNGSDPVIQITRACAFRLLS
jgi:hypothetical protein